jgi:arsenate reductase-like glutaredoxin family protein
VSACDPHAGSGVPARLWPVKPPAGQGPPQVQVFGIRKNADVRHALRFFAERRIKVHFVDLADRPASRGELLRFAQRFGIEALLDRDGPRFADQGLRQARYSEDRWLERLVDDPLLLRMPLVRKDRDLTIGLAEDAWRAWAGRTG